MGRGVGWGSACQLQIWEVALAARCMCKPVADVVHSNKMLWTTQLRVAVWLVAPGLAVAVAMQLLFTAQVTQWH
jgi:hypothetical protein